jgi:hypothetical protein
VRYSPRTERRTMPVAPTQTLKPHARARGVPPGSSLRQVILENCNIGDQYDKWNDVLPDETELTAWKGPTTRTESIQFNSGGGYSDRQWYSLVPREVPPELRNQEGQIYRVTEKGTAEALFRVNEEGRHFDRPASRLDRRCGRIGSSTGGSQTNGRCRCARARGDNRRRAGARRAGNGRDARD